MDNDTSIFSLAMYFNSGPQYNIIPYLIIYNNLQTIKTKFKTMNNKNNNIPIFKLLATDMIQIIYVQQKTIREKVNIV